MPVLHRYPHVLSVRFVDSLNRLEYSQFAAQKMKLLQFFVVFFTILATDAFQSGRLVAVKPRVNTHVVTRLVGISGGATVFAPSNTAKLIDFGTNFQLILFVYLVTCILIHSITYPLTHSLAHSLAHSLTHSLTNSLNHSHNCSLTLIITLQQMN